MDIIRNVLTPLPPALLRVADAPRAVDMAAAETAVRNNAVQLRDTAELAPGQARDAAGGKKGLTTPPTKRKKTDEKSVRPKRKKRRLVAKDKEDES